MDRLRRCWSKKKTHRPVWSIFRHFWRIFTKHFLLNWHFPSNNVHFLLRIFGHTKIGVYFLCLAKETGGRWMENGAFFLLPLFFDGVLSPPSSSSSFCPSGGGKVPFFSACFPYKMFFVSVLAAFPGLWRGFIRLDAIIGRHVINTEKKMFLARRHCVAQKLGKLGTHRNAKTNFEMWAISASVNICHQSFFPIPSDTKMLPRPPSFSYQRFTN